MKVKALAVFNRTKQRVIYEVRLEIDPAISVDFDDWLLEHVREMLAFPGFQSATVHRGLELTPGNRLVRLAVYEVRSRRELDSYLRTHAANMRKEGVKRFGRQFAASRQVVPAAEYALADGFALLYDRQRISGGLPVCGNCHTPVSGRFCSNCGQEDRTWMLSLRELVFDFIGDLFNYDSRFFRTMHPLLLKPGWVTTEYLRGRRQKYLPPVRMYIFASLLFFFVAAILAKSGMDGIETGGPDEDAPTVQLDRDLTPEEREKLERELERAEQAAGLPPGSLRIPDAPPAAEDTPEDGADESDSDADGARIRTKADGNFNFSFGEWASEELEARLERGARGLSEDPARFVQTVLQQIPTAMLFFLPLIALLLKILYILSGRYYVEHLIFTLHFHSAAFVLLLLWMLYGMVEPLSRFLQAISGWLTAALWIYLLYYLYKSMRRVYGQGRFVTILKYLLLLFAYLVSFTITAALTMVYAFYVES